MEGGGAHGSGEGTDLWGACCTAVVTFVVDGGVRTLRPIHCSGGWRWEAGVCGGGGRWQGSFDGGGWTWGCGVRGGLGWWVEAG